LAVAVALMLMELMEKPVALEVVAGTTVLLLVVVRLGKELLVEAVLMMLIMAVVEAAVQV
jgi:hypothetical protein